MATANAFTLFFVLFSLFLLSQSLEDRSFSIAISKSESESEPESTAAVGTDVEERYRTVVFHPADVDGPVDPDLIAHSFRLPSHHRLRHGHRHGRHHHRHHHFGEGFIRMKPEEGGAHRGFGGEFPAEFKEADPEAANEKRRWRDEHDHESDSDDSDSDDSDSDSDDELEHKRMRKMKRMRRFGKEEEEGEEEERWGFMDRVRHFFNHF